MNALKKKMKSKEPLPASQDDDPDYSEEEDEDEKLLPSGPIEPRATRSKLDLSDKHVRSVGIANFPASSPKK